MKRTIFYIITGTAVILSLTACKVKTDTTAAMATMPENATGVRFKTLDYLYRISGTKTIAGIHNREPNASPARWTEEIYKTTGQYPGLWSGDFLFQEENIANRSLMIEEAIRQWEKGAVINIMWHACNPAFEQPCDWNNGKGVLSNLDDAQWNELITDGTALNIRWKVMMDEVAVHLNVLKKHGVEVLWRPLHEMNQGKFWWGGRPGENGTRKLYQITHDYLTHTKGLTNLIWVWNVQDFPNLATDVNLYNPGDTYWDVATLDIYDQSGFTPEKYSIMAGVAGDKPIAIGECGKYPTAAQLEAQPKWTFFMGWSELVYEKNTEEDLRELLANERVLTLDQLQGWNGYKSTK